MISEPNRRVDSRDTVCVVGLGYIGLPTAVMFAAVGRQVVGVDTNEELLSNIQDGRAPFVEPGLAELLQEAVASGRLACSASPVEASAFIVAVPTPIRGLARKRADLSYVEAATTSVAPFLRHGALFVLESTSPPGTTRDVVAPLLDRLSGLRAGRDFALAHCPERVLPGRLLHELIHNDRVIGGVNAASAEAARDLYRHFVKGEIHLTDATTAELVKLMENTHRDVNIALANEFALVAEHLGIDGWQAIDLANRHPRVNFLRPGPGVGGHCIAVDPWFVVGAAPESTPLVAAARAVNEAMPGHVVDLIVSALGEVAGKRVAVLGLTYKANVDDVRESPAVEVVRLLEHAGATVSPHDARVAAVVPVEDVVRGADCVVLLVDHAEYQGLDPLVIGSRVKNRCLVDTRNLLPRENWASAGFTVWRLGAGTPQAIRPPVETAS